MSEQSTTLGPRLERQESKTRPTRQKRQGSEGKTMQTTADAGVKVALTDPRARESENSTTHNWAGGPMRAPRTLLGPSTQARQARSGSACSTGETNNRGGLGCRVGQGNMRTYRRRECWMCAVRL